MEKSLHPLDNMGQIVSDQVKLACEALQQEAPHQQVLDLTKQQLEFLDSIDMDKAPSQEKSQEKSQEQSQEDDTENQAKNVARAQVNVARAEVNVNDAHQKYQHSLWELRLAQDELARARQSAQPAQPAQPAQKVGEKRKREKSDPDWWSPLIPLGINGKTVYCNYTDLDRKKSGTFKIINGKPRIVQEGSEETLTLDRFLVANGNNSHNAKWNIHFQKHDGTYVSLGSAAGQKKKLRS